MTDKGSKHTPVETPKPSPSPAPTHVPVRESWKDFGESIEKGHNTVPMQPKESTEKK